MHRFHALTVIRIFFLGVIVGLVGCGASGDPVGGVPDDPPNGEPGDNGAPPTPEPSEVVKVLSISPAGFPDDFSGLPQFFEEAAEFEPAGVIWNGGWREDLVDGSDAGSVPEAALLTVLQGGSRGFEPFLVFGWRSGEELFIRVPDEPINDWSNAAAAEQFGDMLVHLVAEHEPPYIFLGNESDYYFAQDPEDYQRWIAVYEDLYDRVKSASPDTRVGPVFQFEHLSGSGVLAGQTMPHWGALEAHDLSRVDVLGVTLYPFLAYDLPDAVPDDYLSGLTERIGTVPLVITETGWPAEAPEGFQPPWQVGEDLQVTFVETLARILALQPVDAVTWLYLHPPVEPQDEGHLSPLEWQIFHSLSLRDGAGERRPVYDVWGVFDVQPEAGG